MAAFAGVLLLQSAWMTALPMFRGPDEIEHLLRASNVGLGHWLPADLPRYEDPLIVTVQRDLANATTPTCLKLREGLKPEFCTPKHLNSDGTVDIRSNVALYNPLYYAVVGTPLKIPEGEVGAWAVRALGGVLSALMMAWGWVLVASRRRTNWPCVAFLVALTPAIIFATTVAAPNGMSYAAGLLLWAGLLSSRADSRSPTAPAASAVGACVVVLTHTTGIIWVGAAVLTMLCLVGWGACKAFWWFGLARGSPASDVS
ncbi:DUF2142 domain-containing protein [Nocardioides sp. B-3]|uniref:DUF2142 domain-containing protein n=1 Tax=Nocardioides sp. B-3 TaxID=2895565 RepID=UPI0021539205|nr:DUF2142 domain-containing protein [Nocardioides sp. B-3]UUZ59727.1 DUF2142 domain-containing protein [Nocardioides sp. B-3]